MNAVSFDCCGACVLLEPEQSVQDVIDLHTMDCDDRQRFNFLDAVRDEAYRDFALLGDLEARWLNKCSDEDSFEVSGDAIATYKERRP